MTKEKFLKTYNKYPPSIFVKFIYKHFSKETEKTNSKLRLRISFFFIILILFGIIGNILALPKVWIAIPTYIFTVLFFIFIIVLTVAHILNQRRIKKISKELNINLFQFNIYSKKYFNE